MQKKKKNSKFLEQGFENTLLPPCLRVKNGCHTRVRE